MPYNPKNKLMLHIWTILLAAGQSSRLSSLKGKKQFFLWKDRPLFWHSAETFSRIPQIKGIVFVFPPEDHQSIKLQLSQLYQDNHLGLKYLTVSGGKTRQDSAFKALQCLPKECTHVLIHDAARPFCSPELLQRIVCFLKKGEQAVIPGIPVTDTIKQVTKEKVVTLQRGDLFAVQTPQGFQKDIIIKAHDQAREKNFLGTDDASLVENYGKKITLIDGEEKNLKITNSMDIEALLPNSHSKDFITGFGYDVHRFGQGKPLKLGGIPITNGPNVVAHSDGDVLLHAVIDALLGCLGQGDIGDFFPDTDDRYQGISSGILLAETLNIASKESLVIDHLDITIICQNPKLSPWKKQIKKNLLGLLELTSDQLSLKATTEEGLGFTGENRGIKAIALVSAHKNKP